MTDQTLLMFGCGIFFIALGGAYVALREGFLKRRLEGAAEESTYGTPAPVPVQATHQERVARAASAR